MSTRGTPWWPAWAEGSNGSIAPRSKQAAYRITQRALASIVHRPPAARRPSGGGVPGACARRRAATRRALRRSAGGACGRVDQDPYRRRHPSNLAIAIERTHVLRASAVHGLHAAASASAAIAHDTARRPVASEENRV